MTCRWLTGGSGPRLCSSATLALAIAHVVVVGHARADDRQASLPAYERGKEHYRAGRFAEAIVELEKAYARYPAPEYLYNIAQAYRHIGDCRAVDYYRRFVATEPSRSHRELVDEHIDSLGFDCDGRESTDTDSAHEAEPEASRATTDERPPSSASPRAAIARADQSRGEAGSSGKPQPRAALELHAEAGLARYWMGDVSTPTVAATRLGLGVAWSTGPVELRGSLSAGLSPMGFEAEPSNGRALFTRTLGNVALGWNAGAGWYLGAEVGGGLLLVSGLVEGNPFTDGANQRGTLVTVALRAAASIEYRFAGRFALSLSPAVWSWSPGHDALAPDIDGVTSFAVVAGIRARLWP